MQTKSHRSISSLFFLLSFLALSFVVIASSYGVDSYSIYLNDKLLLQQALDKPLSLKNLDLKDAKASDHLIVRYRECHAPESGPKGRKISIRDEQGKTVKVWKFDDDGQNNGAMKIPVREILEVQKTAGEALVMTYSSDGMGKGQELASL